MSKMQRINNYKILSIILIFLSIFSFFLGFYLDENSAGAGTYGGDWDIGWKNIQIILNNDLSIALNHPDYLTNRTPLIYILHKLFNPFAGTEIGYRTSSFIISLIAPVLFYLCLKQKFKSEDGLLLSLIASIIFLSPYYRTSAYWAFEENYGIISLLLTYLFLNYFLTNNNQNGYKIYFQLFLLTFFSSLCIYFDQKLLIIPIICFVTIMTSKKVIKLKILSIFLYLILSLPFIYLILLWGDVTRPGQVKLGSQLYSDHFGYTITMVAFYFMPLLLFKGKNLLNLIKDFFLKKNNYFLILLFFVYILYLLIFYNLPEQNFFADVPSTGKGFIHKSSVILFGDSVMRKIFVYFSFFISWIIILTFIDKNLKDSLILFYFFILFIFISPIFQEYFDPLILLMVFTFFNSKLFINYKNSIILFLYLTIFLMSTNIYYYNLLS